MTPQQFQEQFNEAWTLRREGQYDKVLAIAHECLPLAEEANDLASQALFLKLFAQTHSDNNELREALKYYKQTERLYIDLEDKGKQMHTLRHIGSIYHELGEFECAEKCLIQVVQAYEATPTNALETANTHRVYALALEGLNRNTEAKTYWQKAKQVYEQLWIPEGIEECDEHLGQ